MPDKTPQKKFKTAATPELFVEAESLELLGETEPLELPGETEPLPPGTIIAEKYEVIECISNGTERAVYKVEHKFVKKTLALKMLTGEMSEKRRERFLAEAKMASLVDSPNIARASDIGTFGTQPFYVMDFAEGVSLADYLKRCGRLTYDDIFAVFIPLANVLQELHAMGVVHCGVMPSNIMLLGEQGNWQSRLIGFGVAKQLDNSQAGPTNLKRYTGTYHYLSPEQCSGRKVDPRTDVYSLGCSLFEAITARPPFTGNDNEAIRKKHISDEPPTLKEASLGRDFPSELEQTVRGMLAKDPQQRTATAQQVAETLMRSKLSEQLRIKTKPSVKPNEAAFEKKLVILGLVSALCSGIVFFIWLKANEPRTISRKVVPEFLTAPFYRQTHGSLPANELSSEFTTDVQSVRMQGSRVYRSSGRVPERIVPDTSTEPFLQKIEDQVGKQLRHYKFPQTGIGQIEDLATSMPAIGQKTFPWQEPLSFYPNADAVQKYPNLFSRFKDDEVGKIFFIGTNGLYEDTLESLATYKKLEQLSFEHVDLNNEGLEQLERLPKLNSLELLSTGVSAGGLEQFSKLRKLKKLALGDMMDVDRILKALHKSENLECLELRNCRNLTNGDIQQIAAFPNLKKFVLQTFWQTDPTLLNGLAASKSLQELDISKTRFGPAGLKGLGTFKQLKILDVSQATVDEYQKKELEKEMPKTCVRYN